MNHAALEPTLNAPAENFPVALIPRINIGVFCEDQKTGQALQAASVDRRMARAHVSIQLGGIPAAVPIAAVLARRRRPSAHAVVGRRSEEHTSELQSPC